MNEHQKGRNPDDGKVTFCRGDSLKEGGDQVQGLRIQHPGRMIEKMHETNHPLQFEAKLLQRKEGR